MIQRLDYDLYDLETVDKITTELDYQMDKGISVVYNVLKMVVRTKGMNKTMLNFLKPALFSFDSCIYEELKKYNVDQKEVNKVVFNTKDDDVLSQVTVLYEELKLDDLKKEDLQVIAETLETTTITLYRILEELNLQSFCTKFADIFTPVVVKISRLVEDDE